MHECVRWRFIATCISSVFRIDGRTKHILGALTSSVTQWYPHDESMAHPKSWSYLLESWCEHRLDRFVCGKHKPNCLNGLVRCGTQHDAQFWKSPSKYVEYKIFRTTTCKLANLWRSKRLSGAIFACVCVGECLKLIFHSVIVANRFCLIRQTSNRLPPNHITKWANWNRNSAKSTRTTATTTDRKRSIVFAALGRFIGVSCGICTFLGCAKLRRWGSSL